MAKVVAAVQAAGYTPYDQLYGYTLHGNDQYIARFREIVTKMNIKDVRSFLKHYKENK